eukprot:scaffold30244_cov19-Tisochrysis_lutea.AAC.1
MGGKRVWSLMSASGRQKRCKHGNQTSTTFGHNLSSPSVSSPDHPARNCTFLAGTDQWQSLRNGAVQCATRRGHRGVGGGLLECAGQAVP